MSDCDLLASFELTREELLHQNAEFVDSTTDIDRNPVKKDTPPKKSKKITPKVNKTKQLAKAAAAKERFKSILSNYEDDSESESETDNVEKLKLEIQQLNKKLEKQRSCKSF